MQRKAAFFGSRVEMLSSMIIVFTIVLFLSSSGVQAEPVTPNGRTVESLCCPTKHCYHATVSPEGKMEFVVTQTTCTCEPEATHNCMKTYRDIEFAITKLNRIHNFGISPIQVTPAPVAPASTDAALCCASKYCLDIVPHSSPWNLVVTLTPTTCTCLSEHTIGCFDSFDPIFQFLS